MQFSMGNSKVRIAVIVCVVILGIIGFRIYTNISENQRTAARASGGGSIQVETMVVSRQDIVPSLAFSANLEPLWLADISPKVSGRLERLYVDEGDVVAEGEILAQMDSAEVASQVHQAEGSLYAARANHENAAIEYERNAKLYEQGAISQRSRDNSRFQRDNTAGSVSSAQGGLNVLYDRLSSTTIRSPRSGVVTRRYLQEGYYVNSGTPIVSVADVSELLAIADVGEGYIAEVYQGANVSVRVTAYGERVFTGKVTRVSPMAQLPARTFKVEITVPNIENQLRAGMFASLSIEGKTRKDALVIPQSALVMREDQKTVYVVDENNVIQQKLLDIGSINDGWVEVLSGLAEGERIVVAGQNRLRQGSRVSYEDGASLGGTEP